MHKIKEECENLECCDKPRFNFPGETKALRCSKHREIGMIDIKRKMCEHKNCYTRPSYNFEHQKPLYCIKHISPGMINVVDKTCEIPECKVIPIFNFPEEIKGKRCLEHSLEGMINVVNRKCKNTECLLIPLFNFPEEKMGIYCLEHCFEGMINVKHKRCKNKQCNTIPNYNYSNKKIGLYCSEHALENMVDVTHSKCSNEKCNLIASFNFLGEKKSIYCFSHMFPGMVDVFHQKFICSSCDLEWRRQKKSQVFCGYCNPTKTYHTKENQIKKLFEKHNIQNIHDKIFKNDYCLKYRPDFLINCRTFYLIVEVDEFGHVTYPEECEIIRMNNISFALDKPTVFIRYNPDNKNFTKKHKEKTLLQEIQKYISMNILEDLKPSYLFY